MTEPGVYPLTYSQFQAGQWTMADGAVTEEAQVCLYVNGHELAQIMCTPRQLDELALGFLKAEGLIDRLQDVADVHVSAGGTCVEVWLQPSVPFTPPQRSVRTSGCGGGTTFAEGWAGLTPLTSRVCFAPEAILARMRDLYQGARLYAASQGIHAAALGTARELVLLAEDVGRHNAVDRLLGQALKHSVSTTDGLLLTTGRISSEMLRKAARLATPVVVSRTAPTSLSIQMAQALHITLIGYARQGGLRVYAAPERLLTDPPTHSPQPASTPGDSG